MLSDLQIWIESGINANSFGVTSILFLALGGLLASLLPCVYPLYPITAGILQKRSSEKKWIHPVLYYFGLSSAYLSFGIIAGLTGGAFNSFLRLPWVNFALFWVFLALALSSVDLLPIRIFGSSFEFKKREGYFGTYMLGYFAGVLSSPCVGPVVVAILIQIVSSTGEGILWFNVFSAALKMFVFGLGLGLPFLFIGVFGAKLPKAGRWMRGIQYGMSLLILYFSFQYLDKAITISGYNSYASEVVFFGVLASLGLFYLIQSEEQTEFEKAKKSFLASALVFLCLSIFLFLIRQTNSVNSDLSAIIERQDRESEIKSQDQIQNGNLTWFRNEREVLSLARRENKLVFIDFYADWCTNCKDFEKLTQKNSELNSALQTAILWKVYDTDVLFETFSEDPRFPELRVGLPFFVIQTPDGVVVYKSNNYLDSKGMIEALSKKP